MVRSWPGAFNKDGELGNGDATGKSQFAPVAVTGFGSGSGVIALAGGGQHSLALKSDGTEWAWGTNRFGQVGNGGAIGVQAVTTPVQVANLNGAVTLAVGPTAGHSLAIVQPVAALSPTSLSFGNQMIGSLSAPQTIMIKNNGQDPLVINSMSVSGEPGDFTISGTPVPFTVSQGASTAVSVAFSPTAAFARLATLLIDGNAFDAPVFVPLSGTGLAQADLAVGLTASTNRVKNGSNLTYTITVKNNGPTPAPDVVMSDALSAGVSFVSSKTSQGTCEASTGMATCNLGTVNLGATATITLTVAVRESGASSVVNTVSAVAQAPDPNLGNNSATVVNSVFGPKK